MSSLTFKPILTSLFLVVCCLSLVYIVIAQDQALYDTNTANIRPCKDVLTLFARGSGQNQGGDNPNNYGESLKVLEPESYQFFNQLEKQIKANFAGLSIDRVSLHNFTDSYSPLGYKAQSIAGGLLDPSANLAGINAKLAYNDGLYKRSVENGVLELAGFLEDHLLRCPNQIVIIGGYSQGAHVVGNAMWLLHNRGLDRLLVNIDQIALFGDPKFDGIVDTGFLRGVSEQFARGDIRLGTQGVLGPRSKYLPDILSGKYTSWCHHQDVVCSGLLGATPGLGVMNTHQSIYRNQYIERAALEIFISLQSKLAALADQDVNARRTATPLSGQSASYANDIMLLLNTSKNMSKDHLWGTRNTLNESFRKLLPHTPSIRAGLAIYADYRSGNNPIPQPTWKIPLDLSEGVYSPDPVANYSPVQVQVGKYTFPRFADEFGNFEDSILDALKDVIVSTSWRTPAGNAVVYFTDSPGLSPEPATGTTIAEVVALAKEKGVAIIPVFYSQTMANIGKSEAEINQARQFHFDLADGSGGHVTEYQERNFSPHELYDILQGHSLAPKLKIGLGKNYRAIGEPGLNFAVNQDVVLSAQETFDPDSKIESVEWDFNGDGVVDARGSLAKYVYTLPYDLGVTVTAKSSDGIRSTKTIPIQVGQSGGLHDLTDIKLPEVEHHREGQDLVITWPQPPETVNLAVSVDQELIGFVSSDLGRISLNGVPDAEFTIGLQAFATGASSAKHNLNIGAVKLNENEIDVENETDAETTGQTDPEQEAEIAVKDKDDQEPLAVISEDQFPGISIPSNQQPATTARLEISEPNSNQNLTVASSRDATQIPITSNTNSGLSSGYNHQEPLIDQTPNSSNLAISSAVQEDSAEKPSNQQTLVLGASDNRRPKYSLAKYLLPQLSTNYHMLLILILLAVAWYVEKKRQYYLNFD